MTRLAGFSADEVVRKLRRAGFVFDRQAKGAMKSGGTHKLGLALLFLVIPVSFPTGQCGLSCTRPI